MEPGKHRRSLIFGLTAFLVLTVLLFGVIHRMDRTVFSALRSLSLPAVLLLAAMGCSYQLLDACVSRCVFQDKVENYTLGRALRVTYLGVFGNIATSAAGTTPMQSYYLYRCGLMAGRGVSLLTLQYVFHKSSILLYATLLLLTQWSWIRQQMPVLSVYLLISYLICLMIIGVLVLSCTWKRVRDLAVRLLCSLPDRGKLKVWKQVWLENLDALYGESHLFLRSRRECLQIVLLNGIKFLILYSIPYVSIRLLHGPEVSLFQVQALSALMLLISNSLPNIAGMGATEFSFLLIFSRLFGADAPGALLLHRLATYYFPFFLSCIWVLLIQRELTKYPLSHTG